MITAASLRERLAGLEEIGTGPAGVNRFAWTDEDARSRRWFADQAAELGLRVQTDPAGNLWACPEREPPWWGIGSHLDSVRAGGRFDGPLGVACGFEIAATASAPVAVLSFADEEGTRFNTPTFGSKALAGRLDLPAVLGRPDAEGVTLGQAMRTAGIEPERIGEAPDWLGRLAGFVEIHIDQTTDLARAETPVGIVSSLTGRMRVEAEVLGRADHAGATPPQERRDALAAAARLILGSAELGREVRVTTSRLEAEPNASTTIASRVRVWIDARAPKIATVDAWLEALRAAADELAEQARVEIRLHVASRSGQRSFSPEIRAELERAAQALGISAPELTCFAGHDAGVLAERVPAAMLLVRNPTGVSHSPDEAIELEDAAAAASVVAAWLRDRG